MEHYQTNQEVHIMQHSNYDYDGSFILCDHIRRLLETSPHTEAISRAIACAQLHRRALWGGNSMYVTSEDLRERDHPMPMLNPDGTFMPAGQRKYQDDD